MATEAIVNNIEEAMMYYGTSFIQEADFPINFYLKNLKSVSGNDISESIVLWMKNMPQGKWPNWMVGDSNTARISSRIGKEYINVINMLLLTLPGTPVSYYGEEIGMEDATSGNWYTTDLTNLTDNQSWKGPCKSSSPTPPPSGRPYTISDKWQSNLFLKVS
uniref:Glycosyl hydrolase family 13 catalytic domain-containing protein n=1 Tax=Laticauda laticaudata TaxID=8630 RepID=A0A8C5SMX0_LATLA